MSDQWEFFPCQMGDKRAFVFVDHGIHETIDQVAPGQLLRVRVAFNHPRQDGMPTNEEFPQLKAIEDGLQGLVDADGGAYVGRVTVGGHRDFYIYTSGSEESWSPKLRSLGREHGHSVAFSVEADEQHNGYWRELFPTADDWQVIQDMRVLEVLEKHGDDGTSPRRVDHWAYFPSQAGAEQFVVWLRGRHYGSVTMDAEAEGKVCVRFTHEGPVQLEDITSHTIALRRKASELDGEYDGWETQVCAAQAEDGR
jgi:hypothetical protein